MLLAVPMVLLILQKRFKAAGVFEGPLKSLEVSSKYYTSISIVEYSSGFIVLVMLCLCEVALSLDVPL